MTCLMSESSNKASPIQSTLMALFLYFAIQSAPRLKAESGRFEVLRVMMVG